VLGFEGRIRNDTAEEGIKALRSQVDALIVIPNDRLAQVASSKTTLEEAFRMADDVLRQGVQGISDIITVPGLINLDFADVRTIMKDAGSALMGIGYASGENRAREAAERALRSPLIETEITGARGILLSIAGGDDLSLFEVNEAAEVVRAAATDDTNIIFGATIDDPTRFGIREQSGSATVDLRRSIPRQLYPPKAAAIAATAKMRVVCQKRP